MAIAAAPLLTSVLGLSAGTAAGVGTLLSVGTGVMGAMSAINAGKAQSSMYKNQAQQYELNAQLEKIKGRQEALTLKQQRDQNIASINATFAARGVYSGSGTAAQASIESRKNAADAIDMAMFNSTMQSSQLRGQAANLRTEARTAKRGGYIDAITGLAKNRGVQSLLDM